MTEETLLRQLEKAWTPLLEATQALVADAKLAEVQHQLMAAPFDEFVARTAELKLAAQLPACRHWVSEFRKLIGGKIEEDCYRRAQRRRR